MKQFFSVGFCLLGLIPQSGMTADNRVVHPLPSNAPAVVMPISADLAEPRSAVRLRDVLRYSNDEADEDNKPYRMSAQERQRLREQLRRQSHSDANKK